MFDRILWGRQECRQAGRATGWFSNSSSAGLATGSPTWTSAPRALLLLTAILSGCGYVGNPLPPALDIPQRVTDLAVAEYGDKIRVQFTLPAMTTEGLVLKSVRSVDLYVGPSVDPWNQDVWAASAKHFPIAATGPGTVDQQIPAKDWI